MIDQWGRNFRAVPCDLGDRQVVNWLRQYFIRRHAEGTLELGQDDPEMGDRNDMRVGVFRIDVFDNAVHTR